MSEPDTLIIAGHIDLAARALGGRALQASDEFFAPKESLLDPQPPRFVAEAFTDRGKWMDGWESRRKRQPGHDWCIVALGSPGSVRAADVDTRHFLGNSPTFASLEGTSAPPESGPEALVASQWRELIPQGPLRPGSHNLLLSLDPAPVTHVRLNIFPDGGVARLRVYGQVAPDWAPPRLDEETQAALAGGAGQGLVDLAALANGATALACSDAFFAPMHHLLLPGRAENQGGGWETRRKRAPGHDWLIVRLGARGRARLVEVDTNHFKGNFPERCAIEVLDAPAASRVTDLIATDRWQRLLGPEPLGAHRRHFFRELACDAAATHLRLCIYPDGGVSRLRVWGLLDA